MLHVVEVTRVPLLGYNVKTEKVAKYYSKADFSEADYNALFNYAPSDVSKDHKITAWDTYSSYTYSNIKKAVNDSKTYYTYWLPIKAKYDNKAVLNVSYLVPSAYYDTDEDSWCENYFYDSSKAVFVDSGTKWKDLDLSILNGYEYQNLDKALGVESYKVGSLPDSTIDNFSVLEAYPVFKNAYVSTDVVSGDDEELSTETVKAGDKIKIPSGSISSYYVMTADDGEYGYSGEQVDIKDGATEITAEANKAYFFFVNSDGKKPANNTKPDDTKTPTKPDDTKTPTVPDHTSKTPSNPNPAPSVPNGDGKTVTVSEVNGNDGGIKHTDAIINTEISEVKKAASQATSTTKQEVKIDMTDGAEIIPAAVLSEAKGKNVDLVLDMGGYSWTINGKNIKSDNLKDVNLQVIFNTDNVPSNLVKSLSGGENAQQITLKHDGNFGFKAKLTIDAPEGKVGQYGNLYWYDSTKGLKFIDSGLIAKDGKLSLDFSHASDYVITYGKDAATRNTNTTGSNKSPKTSENVPFASWYVYMMIMTAGASLFIFGLYHLKKDEEK